MIGIYLLVTAAVIAAGCGIIAKMSELHDDFTDYYQDFNRYMDNRVPVSSNKR